MVMRLIRSLLVDGSDMGPNGDEDIGNDFGEEAISCAYCSSKCFESFLSEVPFLPAKIRNCRKFATHAKRKKLEYNYLQEKGSSLPSMIRPLMQFVARKLLMLWMRGSSRYFIRFPCK